MAVSTGLVFTAISLALALGFGICSANRASIPGSLMEGVTKKPPFAGLTEVAGKKNQPYKLNDLGSRDPFGGDEDPYSFPLSQWVGQALYCSPVSCQGGDRNQYGGQCGGFSIYFDFNGPPETNVKVVPPTATGIDHPPVPPNREREDGPGLPTDGNNMNELDAMAGAAEPEPGE